MSTSVQRLLCHSTFGRFDQELARLKECFEGTHSRAPVCYSYVFFAIRLLFDRLSDIIVSVRNLGH